MRNILSKLPKNAIEEIKPLIWQVFRAKSYEVGLEKGKQLIERFKGLYPSAMECLQKDLEECLIHLKFPVRHHRFIRTNNLLERTIGENKRRTNVVGRFPTEKSCLKLVFAVMMRVSANWLGIRITSADREIIKRIREELFEKNTNSSLTADYVAGRQHEGVIVC